MKKSIQNVLNEDTARQIVPTLSGENADLYSLRLEDGRDDKWNLYYIGGVTNKLPPVSIATGYSKADPLDPTGLRQIKIGTYSQLQFNPE